MSRRNIGQGLCGMGRIERVGEQHRVVDGAAHLNAEAAENMQSELQIVHPLGHGGIFKQDA